MRSCRALLIECVAGGKRGYAWRTWIVNDSPARTSSGGGRRGSPAGTTREPSPKVRDVDLSHLEAPRPRGALLARQTASGDASRVRVPALDRLGSENERAAQHQAGIEAALVIDVAVGSEPDHAIGVIALGHDEPIPRAGWNAAGRGGALHQPLRDVGVRIDRSGRHPADQQRVLKWRLPG